MPILAFFRAKFIYLSLFALLVLTLIFSVALAAIPLSTYFDVHSLFYPHPLTINDTNISWQELKQALTLVSIDKKTRQKQIQEVINLAVEREILRQYTGDKADRSSISTTFDELRYLREQIKKNSLDWRTGGYFIARFKTPPQATESATVLEQKAKDEINKMRNQLNQETDTKALIKEANNNLTLLYLNQSAFIPGTYLERITEDQFPLKIKNLRNAFFQIPAGTVSGVLTLSWDDYDGVSYGEKFTGEFAYAVIKIEQVNPGYFKDYNSWLDAQKQKAQIRSFVFVPFFLQLLSI